MNRTMSASCSIVPDSRRSDSCGPLVLAVLDRAAELRQREHRHAEFLGQRLQAAGDLADLLHPVLVRRLGRALEQLEIVDHDDADPLLPLEPPGAGPERGDRQRRRIVDVERQLRQLPGGAREAVEFRLADLAHPQVLGIDPRLLGENARRELVGAHLEAEEGDARPARLARLDPVGAVAEETLRRREGDVGRQRRLAHRRPRRRG